MLKRVTIRNFLLIAIVAVSFGLGMRMCTQRRDPVPEPTVDALPADADLSLQDFQYTETSDGLRRWTLTAKSAAYDAGKGTSAVQDMRVEFFDREGHEQMLLTAREGSWSQESGEIEARGNVIVETVEGYRLFTEKLHYVAATGEVATDQPVRMLLGNVELSARGMQYGLKTRLLKAHSSVRATFDGGIGDF